MPTASAGLRGGSYATVYRNSCVPVHHTATHTQSTRSQSASRIHPRAGQAGISSTTTFPATTLQLKTSSRPLPPGPGPLDRHGKKIETFSLGGDSKVRIGKSSLRPGPLKADHNSVVVSTTWNPTSDRLLTKKASPAARSEAGSQHPTSTIGSGLSGHRSSSLANLHISDDPNTASAATATINTTAGGGSGAVQYDSDSRLARSSSRRRSSQVYDGIAGGSSSSQARQTSGSEKGGGRKGSGVGGASLRCTAARTSVWEAGPSTSSRDEGLGAAPQDPSTSSKISSRSSSSSSSINGKGRGRDGGKIGLRNLGNTCFMNSVLQCLSNTQPLLEWCLNDSFTADINTSTSSMKGALVKAFASLLKSLWKEASSESYVNPTSFKTQIQKFAPRFMGYSQQDAQEFLRYLLEGIHEDVNRIKVKPKPVSLEDNRLDKKNDHDKAKEYWNAYLMRDSSHIVDIFVGQLKSELKFTDCGHRSVTFDPFWDLSLPIPKSGSDQSLDNCLRQFMKEEELEAEERPMCTKCKMRRSCTKSFSIQRFPQILVFHLKRFSQERYGRKLNAHIDFPVKGLDLSDYSSEGGQKVTYDLYAVSNHSGGVHSGHYTAMCKNPYTGDWYTFNDNRVSGAQCNQAVSSEAYLLFYELKKS